ncbi:sulfotransferase [Billgrantia lactosivorans]|uniref:sulfotransferase n=1 Tax=Billgrantia lactosivorans TaxID=2185141 RepID=UPI000DAB56CC|nr:sulfotransferase [Halomonas lactosivorans]
MSQSPSSKQLQQIDVLIQRRQLDEALEKAQVLRARYPRSQDVTMMLGLTLVSLLRYEEALPYLETAAHETVDKPAVLAALGMCYYGLGRFQEALAPLQRALQLEPHRLPARNNLGNAYVALGELNKARDCYAENLRRDPVNPGANYSLATFKTYIPEDDIFTALPLQLENRQLPLKDRATLAYTLGKAYWDIGDFEQSFASYRRANELAREARGSVSLPERGLLESIQRLFQPETFACQQAGGMDEIPTLFITGMSRSGKSLVESLLDSVEGVCCGGETDEFRFYFNQVMEQYEGASRYLEQLTPERCRADAQGYLDAIGFDGTLRTATRPMDIWALGLVGLWFPKAPIVFCRRRLEDIGVSAYFNHYTEANDHTYDLYVLGEHIAYYEQAMQHWARVLPNPIYWVDYEELAQDPEAVADRLLKALGKSPRSDLSQRQAQYASFVAHLSPVRSLDVPMPIRSDFVGISEPFDHHLEPLRRGYRETMEVKGLPAQPVERFDWQLKGRLVAIDNGARLPSEENFGELMATNAFGVVAFDPGSHLAAEEVEGIEEFQHVPHALLGDGQPATLYATLDKALSSVLPPLPAERLPESLRSGCQALAKLPINTLRLDDIEGLASLDWLILDELCNAIAVLENGTRALKDTLLLQVRLAFQPTHECQPNFAEVSHWASRHGFTFYRLNNPSHRSLLPKREDIARPQATQLANADALFIPTPERLAVLNGVQRQRLAFLLDAVFGIHDLPYQLLAECDEALAERYLKARGYVGIQRMAGIPDLTPLFTVRKAQRIAERCLAAALASHNIHRAKNQAQLLLKECPGDNEGRYYLGQALSHLGLHDEALSQLALLYGETRELRYGLALGWAQHRAGQAAALKRTVAELGERYPQHLAVARLELTLVSGSHERRELNAALERCEALLAHTDSALVAAGLGDGPSARADLLGVKAALQLGIANTPEACREAQAVYQEALKALKGRQGPLRARLLIGVAEAQSRFGELSAAVISLWQACATYPYSLETVAAYAKLREALSQSPDIEHRRLSALHERVQTIWRGYQSEQLQYSFGDFGLPYQGFEPLKLPGTRSAKARLAHYGLEEVLPQGATALDIGCNHGFLLLGLADILSAGEGFDISKACVEVGNAVARHLGHSHITLHHKAFDDFVGKKQYDLVIACAVHQWIGKPLESFGEALFGLCKPGGIVLLESQGARDRHLTEPGFDNNATVIASAGFTVLRKGSLCDDSLNYREFWLLRRDAVQPALEKPRNTKRTSKAGGAAQPAMEGDAAVLAPMRRICQLLAKQGAWFNPDLVIRAENGNLSLHGTPGTPRASYLRVPMATMPQLDCFDIRIQNGILTAAPNGTPLLPFQHEMMEALLELYNSTHKLELWRRSLPFLAWQEAPGVLDYLLGARPRNSNLTRYHEQFKAGRHDQLLVDSFIGSRMFGVTEQHLKALGIKGDTALRHVLLPLVDCLNHRLDAESFYTPLVGGQPAMRVFGVPDKDSGELFVRYNLYDAVDTTLSYGFMDTDSPWLASVPVTLSVSGQTLQVQGLPMQWRGPLPAAFEDIRDYMPGLQRQGERQASVTKLMLCSESPYSLRRVLTYLVYELGIAHTDLVARQQVAELERQLLDKNREWWGRFELLTEALEPEHPARQLYRHSLDITNRVAAALGY